MERLEFDAFSNTGSKLGESPAWSPRDNSIWWVDIDGRRLLRTVVSDGSTTSWETPEVIGFVVSTSCDDMLVGMETGLFLFDPSKEKFTKCAPLDEPDMRFNDATVDAQGRLWAGTMDIENQKSNGVLFVIGPDLVLHPVANGFRTINGLAVDDQRRRLYVSDSHPTVQKVWSVDVLGAVQLAQFSVFADFNLHSGRPDGACLDTKGNYWIAAVDGGSVLQFSPNGALLASHKTEMAAPTKPMFFGPSLDQICLTSKSDAEWAGCLSLATLLKGQSGGTFQAFNLG